MELSTFIGKIVYNPTTRQRYRLSKITSPIIEAVRLTDGIPYAFPTINGDPISGGMLVFEDPALLESFKVAYAAYGRTKDAFWEEYGYWMRKD